jgi:hypothetical protein
MADKLSCMSWEEWGELIHNPKKLKKRFRGKRKSKLEKMDIELKRKNLEIIRKDAEIEKYRELIEEYRKLIENAEIEEKYSELVEDRKWA